MVKLKFSKDESVEYSHFISDSSLERKCRMSHLYFYRFRFSYIKCITHAALLELKFKVCNAGSSRKEIVKLPINTLN